MIQKIMQSMKLGVQRLLASQGYALVHNSNARNRCTMDAAIRAINNRKHSINTVIDIGASDGRWSASAMAVFPECEYLLIEAQATHEKELQQFCQKNSNAQFAMAAAGEAVGKIYFKADDPFGGQASHVPYSENNMEVPVTTLDNEIQSHKLSGPFLIKFDTHGFELPILKGASAVLKETEVIVMECYNYKISEDCLLFFEMCNHLKGHGFRCIDLVEPMYRPHDDTFWQVDLVFVRDSRPEFEYSSYK